MKMKLKVKSYSKLVALPEGALISVKETGYNGRTAHVLVRNPDGGVRLQDLEYGGSWYITDKEDWNRLFKSFIDNIKVVVKVKKSNTLTEIKSFKNLLKLKEGTTVYTTSDNSNDGDTIDSATARILQFDKDDLFVELPDLFNHDFWSFVDKEDWKVIRKTHDFKLYAKVRFEPVIVDIPEDEEDDE